MAAGSILLLHHPELVDTPLLTAEVIANWWQDGRIIGLAVCYVGEHFYRHLTNKEVEELQREDTEPCGTSTG